MTNIALFDSGLLKASLANNQINAKSDSSNQDFYGVMSQAQKEVTAKEQKNTVVEKSKKNDLPKNREAEQTVETRLPQENEVTSELETKEEIVEEPKDVEKVIEEFPKNVVEIPKYDEDVIKEIEETLAEIMMVLEQMIGQDSSNITASIEELDIDISDFLNMDPKELVLKITNEEDVSLITNENLLNTVTEATSKILELIGELENSTKLPKETLDEMFNVFMTEKQNETVTEPVMEEIDVSNILSGADQNRTDALNEQLPQEQLFQPETHTDEKNVMVEIDNEPTVITNVVNQEENTEKVNQSESKTQTETSNEGVKTQENMEIEVVDENTYQMNENDTNDSGESKEKKHDSKETHEFINEAPVQKNISNQNEIVSENIENFEHTNKTDQESILKQIQDNLKIIKQDDETTMEFQLHPQSLGTVKIALTTRGGSVTAQFSAQNETVKQALESQVTQLRSNLEEQGVKIEAIEISIESHNLERNLDQHGENKRDQQSRDLDEKITKVRRRNINLKAWANGDEIVDEDDLDEDTRLTAQMMEMYGNSMDLLA